MNYSLNKREKVLVFIALGVFLFYVFFNFLIFPQWERNQELGRKIISQNNQLKTLKAKAMTLPALEVKEDEGELKLTRVSDFLSFVSKQAILAGLEVISIIPRNSGEEGSAPVLGTLTVPKGGNEKKMEIEVRIKGAYLGLLEFLEAFEKGVIPAAAAAASVSKLEDGGVLDIGITFNTSFYSGS